MIKTGVQMVRGVGFASVLILSTWTFFLPIAGFHHMIICGVLGPVCLDGETPRSGDLLWGEYDVKIFQIALPLAFYYGLAASSWVFGWCARLGDGLWKHLVFTARTIHSSHPVVAIDYLFVKPCTLFPF